MLDNARDMTVWLIWLALVPFFYCTAMLWIDPGEMPRMILAEITWASVVLAFIGGNWWERSAGTRGRSLWTLYALVPLAFGFIAQLVETVQSLWLLSFSFLLLFGFEVMAIRKGTVVANHLAVACLVGALCLQIMLWGLKATGLY